MPSNGGRVCAACVGALVVHVCVADMYGDERPRETVIATSPHVHGTHDDRPAEHAVDHAIYARQVVAAATTSGRPLDWLPNDGSSDVVVQAAYRRLMASASQSYEARLVRVAIGTDRHSTSS